MRGKADPTVADPELGVGKCSQRGTAAVAEQDHRFGAAAEHLVGDALHVEGGLLVDAVRVVVHVPRSKAAHRVPGGSEQRARVVHTEVRTRMGKDDGGLPSTARRCPQEPASEPAVGRHEADRLALELDAGVVFRERPVGVPEGSAGPEMDVEVFHVCSLRSGPDVPGWCTDSRRTFVRRNSSGLYRPVKT